MFPMAVLVPCGMLRPPPAHVPSLAPRQPPLRSSASLVTTLPTALPALYAVSSAALCVSAVLPSPARGLDAGIRFSIAAIALTDLSPNARKQLADAEAALKVDRAPARRWAALVRAKVACELLALGLMLCRRGASAASAGLCLILSGHILFWLAGAASCRVNAAAEAAPVPPALVRVLCTADAVLLACAALGAAGPTPQLRITGRALCTVALTALSTQKLVGRFQASMSASSVEASRGSASTSENGSPRPPRQPPHSKMSAVMPITSFPRLRRAPSMLATEAPSTVPAAAAADEWSGFSWKRNWYPLAFSRVTDKAVPHRIEIFGDPLVLWYDHVADRWAAMSDVCPHRLAPLSEGRIDEAGNIECPYHGWAFCSSSGACMRIPQAAGELPATLLQRSSGVSYAVTEVQGLIWVWGEAGVTTPAADVSLVPRCEALDDPSFTWIDVSRDMPYSADFLLENVLDSSHVPFTHHQTISKRENASPMPLRLTRPVSPLGFEGEFGRDVPVGKVGQDAAAAGKATERTTAFRAPTYMHHRIRTLKTPDGEKAASGAEEFETWTVAMATPTGPGRCRLFARFPFRFPPPRRGPNVPKLLFDRLPDWLNHLGQLRVLDDDNIFLPLQERAAAEAGGARSYVTPTASDTYVLAYRRWFERAGRPPYAPHATNTLEPHISGWVNKAHLLDRKAQHTDHCKHCTDALQNALRADALTSYAMVALAAVIPSLLFNRAYRTFGAVAFLLGPLALGRACAKYVASRLVSGLADYPPPRNRPSSKVVPRELRTVEQGRVF